MQLNEAAQALCIDFTVALCRSVLAALLFDRSFFPKHPEQCAAPYRATVYFCLSVSVQNLGPE